jgi:hypothetical protein
MAKKVSVIKIKPVGGTIGVKATKGTKRNDRFVPLALDGGSTDYYVDGGKGDADYLYLPYDMRDITRLQISSGNSVLKNSSYFEFDNFEETPVNALHSAGGQFSLKNIEYIVTSNGTLQITKSGLRLSDWRPDEITGIISNNQSIYAPDAGVWRATDSAVGRISMTSSAGRAFVLGGNNMYLDSNSDGSERDANGFYEDMVGSFRGLENVWYQSTTEYRSLFQPQASWAIYPDSNLGILFSQDGTISGWLSLDM